jgi:uncharacterized membrane-anchored protein
VAGSVVRMRDVHPAWSRKVKGAEQRKRARRVARRALLALAVLASVVAAGPLLLALLVHLLQGLSAFMWAKTGWGRDALPLMVVASVAGVLLWLLSRRFREPAASRGRESA